MSQLHCVLINLSERFIGGDDAQCCSEVNTQSKLNVASVALKWSYGQPLRFNKVEGQQVSS